MIGVPVFEPSEDGTRILQWDGKISRIVSTYSRSLLVSTGWDPQTIYIHIRTVYNDKSHEHGTNMGLGFNTDEFENTFPLTSIFVSPGL